METAAPELLPLLKKHFGFTSFRPLQEDIIRDSLAGRDVLALLPTGGGKSLCFQLPALLGAGLTVVVSPLIALMKDQVDALQASGIAATFLNSSLAPGEARQRLHGLHNGQYRLLYAAPERLMLAGLLSDLQRWNVRLLAIDEAHCISEWGHDFRPEYRQLGDLRGPFPQVPIMALTATATAHVRADIIKLLQLREPRCYVASFNRSNLTYRVLAKCKPYAQVLEFVLARPGDSGIIYCQSRKTAENLAARLNAGGVKTRPYHAGLTPKERSAHQELFRRDEVRVICATIAFGMGINKPNVRFVIHYDLPKNIEGYYQQTGRAGRDGLPGECVLLFSAGDVIKYSRFIDEKSDPQERRIAREQLQQMAHYAEGAGCRRVELLRYFGEEYSPRPFPGGGPGAAPAAPAAKADPSRCSLVAAEPVNCKACDNCLTPQATFDGTIAAQKFLACVYRIRERSRFGVGLNHVVEVLTGGDTEKIRRWGHDRLSTYGIGREHRRPDWAALGRELIRLGYLRQTAEKFSVLELTDAGLAVLKERRPVTLTKPATAPESNVQRVGEIICDKVLFEHLRELRKRLADERDVPAYIVFADVALRQMARNYPANEREFARISGVGEKKLREFAPVFLGEIAAHLQTHPRQVFADDSLASPGPPTARDTLGDSAGETLRRFRAGQSVVQIARERSLAAGTIYGHLAEAMEYGESIDLDQFFTPEEQKRVSAAFARHGLASLSKVFESLQGACDYGRLRIFRAALSPTVADF